MYAVRQLDIYQQGEADAEAEALIFSQTLYFSNYLMKAMTIGNLNPNTTYTYTTSSQIESSTDSGIAATTTQVLWKGSFRTPHPENTRQSFTVAAGGCSMTGSQHHVFRDIVEKNTEQPPLFMLHMGDFHYQDLTTTSLSTRLNAFDLVLGSEPQAYLYANLPIAYMWDDHDYVGNNADGSNVEARNAARESYGWSVPHYPLAALTNTTTTIITANATTTISVSTPPAAGPVSPYQAFTIGTVRFILTDLRSESSQQQQRIYSFTQEAWFQAELAQFESYDFVVWVTSRPWIGEDPGYDMDDKEEDDTWQGFPADRQRLIDYLDQIQITNLLVVSSDNHMVAYDDGSHTTAGFPLVHAGPLSNFGPNSLTKHYFTDGCHASYFGQVNHHYVMLHFDVPEEEEEEDNPACVDITAYDADDGNRILLSKRICNPLVNRTTSNATADEEGEQSISSSSSSSQYCQVQVFSSTGKAIYWSFGGLSFVFACLAFGSAFFKNSTDMVPSFFFCGLYIVGTVLSCVASGAASLTWGVWGPDTIIVGYILLAQAFLSCAYMVWWGYVSSRSNRYTDDSHHSESPSPKSTKEEDQPPLDPAEEKHDEDEEKDDEDNAAEGKEKGDNATDGDEKGNQQQKRQNEPARDSEEIDI